jgi:predicted aminopeptidase
VSTYHRLVPAFEALYEREGQDFAAFYRAAEVIGQLPPEEREARLRVLPVPAKDYKALINLPFRGARC